MIRNVGANNSSNIMNEMKKNEDMAVEKQQIKEQTRIDELKQQVKNDEYKIDLRSSRSKTTNTRSICARRLPKWRRSSNRNRKESLC